MATPWTPWHEVVDVREDLKSGKLTLDAFAADLYDVLMQHGERPVYEDPTEFFKLTYPTHNLRELAREVAERLRGESAKAIRQLELTYGGGKTHTLITLYHLFSNPDALPDLPAVKEFSSHIGHDLPKARVAALPFDYLDTKTGIDASGPDGGRRQLNEPWSVLAYQLAGDEGLRILSGGDTQERNDPPATGTLSDILAYPQKEGRATLILLDEILMYAQNKVGSDRSSEKPLINFFQCLTQAASRVDQCCLVASILASDLKVYDQLGKQLERDVANIFRRKQDESVRPVEKQDIAEVLRRRFFTLGSIRDRESFRPHVTAALKGIRELDDETQKQGQKAEERYLKSYPFHPGLTDVFYEKWTNLEAFQRARGVLRVMALAIREAVQWDNSPLISTNVFLSHSGSTSLNKAASELANIASQEEYEGKRQNWSGILEGELERARDIEARYTGLTGRDIEQAMFGIFLHSQPKGHEAQLLDLMRLIGHTRPDKIELDQALKDLITTSWFLDEEYFPEERDTLPREWRLGSRPNLTQMHHEARSRVEDLVETNLIAEINKANSLKSGAAGAGARVHMLPNKPGDIKDDGAFHYAILGPEAASYPGQPSERAEQFLFQTTTADRPRVNKNAVVLAVPSPDGLDRARSAIRNYLAWEEVKNMLKDEDTDPIRDQRLSNNLKAAKEKISDAVRGAYSVAVTVGRDGRAEAFKVPTGESSLFAQIKNHDSARIKESAITPGTILPGGPYDLWREDEPSRRVSHISKAFAQRTELPKMLRPEAIFDTIALGCEEGTFVLRLPRPDGSMRTWWRSRPGDATLKEAGLEAVLPEHATLTSIEASLLEPDALPELWREDTLSFRRLLDYFSGDYVAELERDGYTEQISIPEAERDTLEEAVRKAVQLGFLWLRGKQASLYEEAVPGGVMSDEAYLQPPPDPIPPTELLPMKLSGPWDDGQTTAAALSEALSEQYGQPLPWKTVLQTIDGAFQASYMKRAVDSGAWPTDRAGAGQVKIELATDNAEPRSGAVNEKPRPEAGSKPDVQSASADLEADEIQNLADEVGELVSTAAAYGIRFHVRIETGGDEPLPDDVAACLNEILGRVSSKLEL